MIAICSCQCGSTDSLIRSFLKSVGYQDWMSIPIERGRERSLSLLANFPPSDGKEMLQSFLKKASKWAIIIGYDDSQMLWSDIAHNGPKSRIEAEYVIKSFC